ncbi:hypothetical protein [Amycolatopsis sp. lyj-346]|uniref:hypothetical protein n=1 Tax=Amycolatopsis sp. lyj-346 TaxID=2789289 RepID=UPI00397D7BDD
MAVQLRHLYGCGAVTGWALQPMPETRTSLHTVKQAILQAADGLGRGLTQLTRGGSVHTIDSHRGSPGLPGLSDAGGRQHRPRHPSRSFAPSCPGAQVAELFTSATRARYPRLVEQLAASRMPDAALAQIAAALNGEPLPAADPMVDLLLDIVRRSPNGAGTRGAPRRRDGHNAAASRALVEVAANTNMTEPRQQELPGFCQS